MRALLRSRTLGVLLLAAVLLGKALVPAGWMPAQTAQGLTVLICSGDGPARAFLDASGQITHADPATPDSGHPSETRDPCPFAALALAAPLPQAPAATGLPPVPAAAPPAGLAAITIGQGLAAPPPWATGPPRSA